MWAWALIFLAVFLIGITKSGFGSGVGLMIVPMTAIGLAYTPYGEKAALGLLLPLLIVGDFVAIWQYRHLFSTRIVRKLLPGTIVGVLMGGAILFAIERVGRHSEEIAAALFRIDIGLESVVLVGLHWWRILRGEAQKLMREPLRSNLTGGFAAVSSTIAHAAGPVIALYLLPLKLDRQLFVGTCAIYFFILNSAKIPAYYLTGQFAAARIGFTLRFLPLVLAGALVGWWMNRAISDKLFIKLIYFVTFALGWYILIDGSIRLFRHA